MESADELQATQQLQDELIYRINKDLADEITKELRDKQDLIDVQKKLQSGVKDQMIMEQAK